MKGKFIGFDDNGKLVLKGKNGLRGNNDYINFYDDNGKIARRMQRKFKLGEGTTCIEYMFKDGKIIKKSFAPHAYNSQFFTNFADGNTRIQNVTSIILPQKFGKMKIIKPKGVKATVLLDEGDKWADISIGEKVSIPNEKGIIEEVHDMTIRIKPRVKGAKYKSYYIPLDKTKPISVGGGEFDNVEFRNYLRKFKSVCEEIKDNEYFSLEKDGYNILDVLKERFPSLRNS